MLEVQATACQLACSSKYLQLDRWVPVPAAGCCSWHRGWHLPSESSELEAEEGDLVEAVQSSISTPIQQETTYVGRVDSFIRCGAQRGCAGTETKDYARTAMP